MRIITPHTYFLRVPSTTLPCLPPVSAYMLRPYHVIRKVLEAELGAENVDTVFSEFDQTATAAASLAQVGLTAQEAAIRVGGRVRLQPAFPLHPNTHDIIPRFPPRARRCIGRASDPAESRWR